jgi:hypothetical protein
MEMGFMCDTMVMKLLGAASLLVDGKKGQEPFVTEVAYVAAN